MKKSMLLNKKLIITLLFFLFTSIAVVACLYFYSSIFSNNNFSDLHDKTEGNIEFMYMDKSTVNVGETETFCVSFFNDEYAKSSSLLFHKEDSSSYCIQPTIVKDEVALYDIHFDNKEDVGKYILDEISWSSPESGSQAIDKEEKGYSFKVEADFSSYSSDELPAGIYNLGTDGIITESDRLDSGQTQMLFSGDAAKLKKEENKTLTICLDPGHGGSEFGACYNGQAEKWQNLRIAQVCRDELSKCSGVNVIMTRDGDWNVSLQDRAIIAKNNGADLFVSFHNNAGWGTGSEVWVQYAGCTWHNEFNAIGTEIANRILDKLCNVMGLANRGIKSEIWDERKYPDESPGDNFAVLYWSRYYEIPGLLIEHAFMDGDYSTIVDDSKLYQMGVYDAWAIADYYGLDENGPSDILSGTYTINSCIDNNKVLDVYGSSAADKAKINVSQKSESKSQRWKVETQDNEWVTIQNVNSGKFLDAENNKVFDGSGLQQYSKNDDSNQLWKIMKINDSYKIVSKKGTMFAIDIPAFSLEPDNYLEMYSYNGGKNQLFNFDIDIPGSDADIEDGYYAFASKMDNNLHINIKDISPFDGAKCETNTNVSYSNEYLFKVEKVGGKYHKIVSVATGKALDVEASRTNIGLLLEQWDLNENLNQLWSIKKENGYYHIYSACNGQVLDCYGGKAIAENPVCLYNENSGDNQYWSFVKKEDPYSQLDQIAKAHSEDISSGEYCIYGDSSEDLCLDVYGCSKEDAADVQYYYNNDGDNQHWSVSHDSKGYVTLTNANSGKALDIYGGFIKNNTKLIQYTHSQGTNQKWIVIDVGNNKFVIQSAVISNLYISSIDTTLLAGEAAVVSYANFEGAMRFTFSKTDAGVDPSDPSFSDGYYKLACNSDMNFAVDLSGSDITTNAKFVLWNNEENFMNQQFEFIKSGNYHHIKNIISDKYLSFDAEGYVKQVDQVQGLAESWSIQYFNTYYLIVNAKTAKVLDVKNGKIVPDAKLCVSHASSLSTQKWYIQKKDDPFMAVDAIAKKYAGTIKNGLYSISNFSNPNEVLDVYKGSFSPTANVQFYSNFHYSNQKWFITNDPESGYVKFTNENSGLNLDVEANKKKTYTNVSQYYCHEDKNQKWIIIPINGSYKIMSALMVNYYLSAFGFPVLDGTNACVSYNCGDNPQMFTFNLEEPTPPKPSTGTYICSQPRTNITKMVNYFYSSGHNYPSWYQDHGYGGNTLEEFCDIIISESIYESVDPAVVFCQAMKETGWLTFTGDVSIDQCNFCGLGATGGGEPGCSFNNYGKDSVRMGIRAQVQHLKRYAVGTLVREGEPVDPRFHLPVPGCAPTVEELGGHWAPSATYGIEIVEMMKQCAKL